MKLLRFAAPLLFAALGLGACAAPAGSPALSEDAVVVADPATPAVCANRQMATLATIAEKTSRYRAFLARNVDGAWNATPPSWSWDSLTGAISFSHRTDPMGPALPAVAQADAEAAARAFLVRNWDLVGYRSRTAAQGALLSAEVPAPGHAGGGFAWTIRAISDEVQDGFEDISGAANHLHFIVDVGLDGVVRAFTTVDTQYLPTLTLATTPSVGLAAAKARVVGTHLLHHPGPKEPGWGTVEDFGVVTANDIVDTGLAVYVDWNGFTFVHIQLAHRIEVERPGTKRTFFVDACSGEIVGDDFP